LIRLAWPDLGPEELAEVAEVLESGRLTMGPKVAELETELARICGREHAVAVSSGTAALHLALLALEIGEGDEVIVPAYTFPATANVVALAGARPVLVDVDPETMNVDPSAVAAAVTGRTRAVMVVHLFGRPARWDEVRAAVPEGVHLVEDAAGALGARRRGAPCGGLGEIACLSFHPRKIVTTGEGGAVVCADGELARRVRTLRHHGQRADGEFETAAFNYRLSDILAAVGLPQLRRLDELLETRSRLAVGYGERLRGMVETPTADEGDIHGWQAYVVRLDRRDEARAALREAGIESQIGTYALHRLAPYADQGPFPGAAACYQRALALPLHPRLAPAELDRVVESLTEIVSK
jgi:dTDP-4-amino-4,6-dideoxygalactose transaminase